MQFEAAESRKEDKELYLRGETFLLFKHRMIPAWFVALSQELSSRGLRLVGAERCCPNVSVCSGCAGNLPCWDTPLVPQWEKLGEEEGLWGGGLFWSSGCLYK